jgi:hypothetical protein
MNQKINENPKTYLKQLQEKSFRKGIRETYPKQLQEKEIQKVDTRNLSKAIERKEIQKVNTRNLSQAIERKEIQKVNTRNLSQAIERKEIQKTKRSNPVNDLDTVSLREAWRKGHYQSRVTEDRSEDNWVYSTQTCRKCWFGTGSIILSIPDEKYLNEHLTTGSWFDQLFITTYFGMVAHKQHRDDLVQ